MQRMVGKTVAWPVRTVLQRKQPFTSSREARRGVSRDEVLCWGGPAASCDPGYATSPVFHHQTLFLLDGGTSVAGVLGGSGWVPLHPPGALMRVA